MTSVTLPDSRVISYDYDGDGRLTGITPDGKPEHGFFYNALEMLEKYLPPTLGGTPKPTQYVYNNDQQMTEIDRPDGTEVDYNYDATTGVLNSISTSSGHLFDYTYETTKGLLQTASSYDGVTNTFAYNGNLLTSDTLTDTSTSDQLSQATFTYNNNFWLTSIAIQGAASTTSGSVNYTYDDDGLVTAAGDATYTYQSTTPLISSMTLGDTSESFSYNTFGELTDRATIYSTTPVFEASYTRDDLGRVATATFTYGATSHTYGYTYDDSGRLTDVTKDSSALSQYVYDDNGNRTGGNVAGVTTTATYDDQDRLLTYNDWDFTYNDNGERTERDDTSTSDELDYTYDKMGRLTSVTLPNLDVITYVYDGLGRMVARQLNGTTLAGYIYKGQQLIGQTDSSGEVAIGYIYGSGDASPDYMIKDGEEYKLIKDQLGSVRVVQKISDGTVSQRLDYDEFGQVTTDTNPGFQDFGYAGGIYDPGVGLVRFGVRMYDAQVGRWLTKDPIGFDGGDTNLYGYTFNDPINSIDSEGEVATAIGGAIGGSIGGAGAIGGAVGGAAIGGAAIGGWYIGSWINDNFIDPYFWNQNNNDDGGKCEPKGGHTSNKSPSNWDKHSNAQRRRAREQGGDKKRQHPSWIPRNPK